MSNNYRFYVQKEAAARAARHAAAHPLRDQLAELMSVVRRCERVWALEERIEKSC